MSSYVKLTYCVGSKVVKQQTVSKLFAKFRLTNEPRIHPKSKINNEKLKIAAEFDPSQGVNQLQQQKCCCLDVFN